MIYFDFDIYKSFKLYFKVAQHCGQLGTRARSVFLNLSGQLAVDFLLKISLNISVLFRLISFYVRDKVDYELPHSNCYTNGSCSSCATLNTMEKREDFKRVVEGINQLEQQLLSIVEDGKVNDKDFAEAEEEVERYFSRCEQALAARKEGLLRELAHKLTAQSMSSFIFLSPLLSLLTLYKKGRQ